MPTRQSARRQRQHLATTCHVCWVIHKQCVYLLDAKYGPISKPDGVSSNGLLCGLRGGCQAFSLCRLCRLPPDRASFPRNHHRPQTLPGSTSRPPPFPYSLGVYKDIQDSRSSKPKWVDLTPSSHATDLPGTNSQSLSCNSYKKSFSLLSYLCLPRQYPCCRDESPCRRPDLTLYNLDIYTMSMLRTALVAALAAKEVAASCAYGTPLMPRAEEGEVPINTFGYSGTIVCYTSHPLPPSVIVF